MICFKKPPRKFWIAIRYWYPQRLTIKENPRVHAGYGGISKMWLDKHIREEVIPLLRPRFKGELRPAKADNLALGLLISAARSFGIKAESWSWNGKTPLEISPRSERISEFTIEEWEVIKNSIRSMKAKAAGARILLPGRDAFVWHL
jgi:hypothetical protein